MFDKTNPLLMYSVKGLLLAKAQVHGVAYSFSLARARVHCPVDWKSFLMAFNVAIRVCILY